MSYRALGQMGHADHFQNLVYYFPLSPCWPMEQPQAAVAAHHYRLPDTDRQPGVDILYLGHIAYALSQPTAICPIEARPQHSDFSMNEFAQAVNHREQGGFAGAVRSDN